MKIFKNGTKHKFTDCVLARKYNTLEDAGVIQRFMLFALRWYSIPALFTSTVTTCCYTLGHCSPRQSRHAVTHLGTVHLDSHDMLLHTWALFTSTVTTCCYTLEHCSPRQSRHAVTHLSTVHLDSHDMLLHT